MTRRRWIADEVAGNRAVLLGKNADHLVRVLRARIGQQFEIATQDGVRLGEILEIKPDRVVFSTTDLPQRNESRPAPTIHLYLAIFKFDRFEWAVEKCTELGLYRLVPVVAGRTDSHLASAAQKRVERWRRIAHEAAQQSRRDNVPEVEMPMKLDAAAAAAPGKRIVLSESERERRLADLVERNSEISLAIGPEGGWSEAELDLFTRNQWVTASLGSTILRAETAAIAAVAIVQALSVELLND